MTSGVREALVLDCHCSPSLPCAADVDQLELPDLHLVTTRQPGRLDTSTVHVGAVQRTHISDLYTVVARGELRVTARDGDVVKEEPAVGMTTNRERRPFEGDADALA